MAKEQWHADILITEDIAKKCISAQFSEILPIQSFKCIGEGWDNLVYLVNQKWVFRFPRRKVAVPLIERENIVLPNLQFFDMIALPIPTFIGKPSNIYPYPFHGYPLIPGAPASDTVLSPTDRSNSLVPLASFLKKLHTIDETKATQMGSGPQIFNRMDFNRIKPQFLERLVKIHKRISPVNQTIVEEEISIVHNLKIHQSEVLVHGDLYARHLVFEHNKLSGIIDWGDMGINLPTVDLAVIHSFYEPDDHNRFIDIYGHIPEESWLYARFLGLYGAITMLIYAHDLGDEHLCNEAIAAVKRINDALLPFIHL